jgi:spore coat protein U domain-containing protein, fimbrial subunit CupE1/2/3/6
MRSRFGLILVAFVILGSRPSFAVTISSTMNVTLQIVAECVVDLTPDLNFATVGLLDSNIDVTVDITVECTSGTTYDIKIGPGDHDSGSDTDRNMSSGTADVDYDLYQDSGHTLPWGQTTGTNTVSGTGTGGDVVHTVYGRVPSQTTPAPDNYTDTVLIMVDY